MMFKNRIEAAEILSGKLSEFKNTDSIVLAIPRGGVPMGFTIAEILNLPLSIILTKKIGHPSNPEFAIGSVTLQHVELDPLYASKYAEYIAQEVPRLREELNRRKAYFLDNGNLPDIEGKRVIIVDDGIATGQTLLSGIEGIKKSNPKEIIVAVPVASPDAADLIGRMADRFICLATPLNFAGVGQFYSDFSQVGDQEVKFYLNRNRRNYEVKGEY